MKQNVLHELFEKQAIVNPNNDALKCGDEVITYQELDKRSSQFSNYLISLGVQSGDVVKICIERSIEMFIGIFGILKCGAAYLPIETEISDERLSFICNDNSHPLFISKWAISTKYTTVIESLQIVNLDTDWGHIEKTSALKKEVVFTKESPAVVLYTSGSTGKPKGVLLSHFALSNHILWNKEAYDISSKEVFLQHASYTFDFSLLEIFLALGSGSLLVLSRPKFHYESFYLLDLIQKERISILCSVPSLLKTYVMYEAFSKCTSLTKVILGGEVLDTKLVRDFFEKSTAKLINTYGPTECSIAVLHWICDRNSRSTSIPIGRPVAGMKIHILNENKVPVKKGEVGEIYISGPGLAQGYYRRPELTSNHFTINEFNERMYKTGDLGS